MLLQLKIVKSKIKTAKENVIKAVPKDKNAGTTAVRQLTEPWYQSNRVAVGDSAFASVATAMKMNEKGLGFIGCVKTVTKLFPNETLKNVQLPGGCGNFFGMTTLNDGIELLAFTWWDRI